MRPVRPHVRPLPDLRVPAVRGAAPRVPAVRASAGALTVSALVVSVLVAATGCTGGSTSGAASSPPALTFSACPDGMTCGAHLVEGLGARKAQVLAAGATTSELAVAMLETEHLSADYPEGDGKTGDAANVGIFKQNWLMLRTACATFAGAGAEQWSDGAALTTDLAADVACLHQSEAFYGTDLWYAGHRAGAGGLAAPGTDDIARYRTAVGWIAQQLETQPDALTDDVRYWVDVPAI